MPGRVVKWISPIPEQCQLCKNPIHLTFSDAPVQTSGGVGWMLVCPLCFKRYGTGTGQTYRRDLNGEFIKIAG